MNDADVLDRLAARAFRGSEEQRSGGWLLRAAPGEAVRRANSALPVDGECDVDVVERWYTERGLVPRVMVSPAEDRGDLDAILVGRGWELEAPTDILVGGPEETLERLAGPAHSVVATELTGPPAALRSLDPVVQLGAAGGAGRATAVLQDGWSIVLALEVEEDARRQGVGSALVRAWARLAEGRRLYLQVQRENTAAHELYARAGFTLSHGYHYRRAPR